MSIIYTYIPEVSDLYYDIGSVSNRNIQLLYEYRILRQPSDNLTAICKGGVAEEISGLTWVVSDRVIEGYEVIYEATLDINVEPESVPFLEFHPDTAERWKDIADFIDIQVADNVIIYSASPRLSDLSFSIYWCYSLRHILSLLEDILSDLDRLGRDYEQLEKEISNFKDTGIFQQRPTGLIPNLVKLEKSETGLTIEDSLYKIMTAEKNRLFVNKTQDNLNTMEKYFNETVEFRFLHYDHYVIDGFYAPTMLISGNGDLVLRNMKGQVIITNWSGTVTLMDCSEVHLAARDSSQVCKLSRLLVSKNSTVYLENFVHQIETVELYANSLCRHWRANVHNLAYVGPGCTYWSSAQVSTPGRIQLDSYTPESNTVFDFKVDDIIGTYCSDFDDLLVVAQKNLTPRLGNYDPPPSPSLYVPHWQATY